MIDPKYVPPPGETYYNYGQKAKTGAIKIISDGGYPMGNRIAVYKADGNYYLFVTGTNTVVYNVNDPSNPQFLRTEANALTAVQAGNSIAAQNGLSDIKIYTASNYVKGLSSPTVPTVFSVGEKYTYTDSIGRTRDGETGIYYGLVGDNASGKFFSLHHTMTKKTSRDGSADVTAVALSVFSPGTGGVYTEERHPLDLGKFVSDSGNYKYKLTQYHNGHLLLSESAGHLGIIVMKDGKPVVLDTDLMNTSMDKYYNKKYTEEGSTKMWDAIGLNSKTSIHTLGSKDYLFIGSSKVIDVYELENISRDIPKQVDICDSGIPGIPCFDGNIGGVTTPEPFKSCEESAGDDPQDLALCKQIMEVQTKSCRYIPSLPFCPQGGGKDEGNRDQNLF